MNDGGICCERAANSLQVIARPWLQLVVGRGEGIVALVVGDVVVVMVEEGGVVVVVVEVVVVVVLFGDDTSGKSMIRSLTWINRCGMGW